MHFFQPIVNLAEGSLFWGSEFVIAFVFFSKMHQIAKKGVSVQAAFKYLLSIVFMLSETANIPTRSFSRFSFPIFCLRDFQSEIKECKQNFKNNAEEEKEIARARQTVNKRLTKRGPKSEK